MQSSVEVAVNFGSVGCPSEETLLAFCEGRLDDKSVDRVGDHLEVCQCCEKVIERLEGQPESLMMRGKWFEACSKLGSHVEAEAILRRRLWLWSSLMGFGALLTSVQVELGGASFMSRTLQSVASQKPSSWIVALLALVISMLVRNGYVRGLTRLRFFEIVVLGLFAIRFALMEIGMMYSLIISPQTIPIEQQLLAGTCVLPAWIVLISSYSVFIPNTGRRLSAVLLILCALAVGIALTMVRDARFDVETRRAVPLTFVVFLGSTSVLCIFSAHDQSQLRRAAAWKGPAEYRPIRLLGSGGMGEVWLAIHQRTSEYFAIKFMRRDLVGDVKSNRRFAREIEITSSLIHPNIVAIHDFGIAQDGTIFYIMEYVAGQNLEQLVHEQGPLHATKVASILMQILSALKSAHDVGRVHCDIKPSNVLVYGELSDRIKLADFGLAKQIKIRRLACPVTTATEIPGTLGFIAPEVLEGGAADARSDIYSLGVLGYFLLTGNLPFANGSLIQTLLAQVRDEIVPPSKWGVTIHVDLESILLRCLARSPTSRFPNATEVESSLSQLVFEPAESA